LEFTSMKSAPFATALVMLKAHSGECPSTPQRIIKIKDEQQHARGARRV